MKIVFLILLTGNAYAIGGVEIPYLIEILSENIKRYEQLKTVIEQGKDAEQLLRVLNEGIDNASGLLSSLPIKDEGVLSQLGEFKQAMDKVREIYGAIPKGNESALFRLHDETVSEGFKMINESREYARAQEKNAKKVFIQAASASPRGAQRMTAQMSAQILHALNQLLRVNSQILKLQSERLAHETKGGKDSTRHFNRMNHDIEQTFEQYKVSNRFPRF